MCVHGNMLLILQQIIQCHDKLMQFAVAMNVIAYIFSGHISGLPSLYPDRICGRITVFGRLEYGISPDSQWR